MRKVWISVLALAAVASLATLATASPAEEAPSRALNQAKGSFASRAWTLEIVGAYAFPADEVGMSDEPGLKVVISNRGFDPAWVDRYWDREHWIDERFRNDEDFVVYLHFDLQGAYQGMSYYFESGDGCGFCFNGATASTVKVADGRIGGRVSLAPKPDETSFDVEFDVPIAPRDHGKALPADGGEPGLAYAAYHQALVDSKAEAVQGALNAANAARFGENQERALQVWHNDHPTERYKIVKAFAQGDRALLVVEGANSAMNLVVQVLMDLEQGAWKIADELPKVKFGD